ncbi:MAG TPA: phosphoribosylanthranilate isomerase [bacterium]|nr:phosphoribosylanthranilate isomerase [bacterium]HPN29645.1 phosphoribosylanthranilate isomerase [bacterium]
MKIKICGITNIEDAELSVKYGADYLGFIFAESPRQIPADKCAEIIKTIKKTNVKSVGVFMNQPINFVMKTDKICDFDLIQLHGNENVREYKSIFNKPVIKRVMNFENIQECEYADYLLFDKTKFKDSILDLKILKTANFQIPYFLAGGLNCENVSELLDDCKAFGLDVSSGIEKSPGKKDDIKLLKFINIAKNSTD